MSNSTSFNNQANSTSHNFAFSSLSIQSSPNISTEPTTTKRPRWLPAATVSASHIAVMGRFMG
jgi:hypothetical protein